MPMMMETGHMRKFLLLAAATTLALGACDNGKNEAAAIKNAGENKADAVKNSASNAAENKTK